MTGDEIPAGWYPDPEQPAAQRWWDGERWADPADTVAVGGSGGEAGDEAAPAGGVSAAAPANGADRGGGSGRPWWQRKRVLLPVTALVGLLLGTALAGPPEEPETPDTLDDAEAAAADAEETLESARQRADDAETALADAENAHADELAALGDGHADAVADLDERIVQLESERDDAVGAAQAELDDEREELLASAEGEAAEILADAEAEAEELLAAAEGRVAALDEREAELDQRAGDLDVAEEREAASTFGNGVHIVGDDIEPGTYRTEGGSNCYWARLSGLSGSFDELIANGLPDGPGTVAIQSGDAGFESSGCADWNRVD